MKQKENINRLVRDFLKKAEMNINFFQEARDIINVDDNEAIYTWEKFGTGRWAIGFSRNKIAFGITNSNNDYSFNEIELDSIQTEVYKDLQKKILCIDEYHIRGIVNKLTTELEKIKNVSANIENFKLPKYTISIEKEYDWNNE